MTPLRTYRTKRIFSLVNLYLTRRIFLMKVKRIFLFLSFCFVLFMGYCLCRFMPFVTNYISEFKQTTSLAEYDAVCLNPETGFYSSSAITLIPAGLASDDVKLQSDVSNLLYLKVDLSAFSGNMTGTGSDLELTDKAIHAFETILEKIKQRNNTIILRFVYDGHASELIENGKKVEPQQDMVLTHIQQLSPVFQKYASTINVIQVGFYGLWGESYYNTDASKRPEYYKQTVQALLDATDGTQITIAVRTTEYMTWCQDLTATDRIGLFNDAIGGSETDLGTYINRESETNWLMNNTEHTFYGGEAILDTVSPDSIEGIGPYNTGMFFIDEAYKLHMSYLNYEWNQALHDIWKTQMYTGDSPEYQDQSIFTYVEDHLGYRLQLMDTPVITEAKSTFSIPVSIRNIGFANPVRDKRADILIVDETNTIVVSYEDIDIDIKDFLSQQTVKKSIPLDLPELADGHYQVYLRLSSGEVLDNGSYYSAVGFVNDDIYSNALQANLICDLRIK